MNEADSLVTILIKAPNQRISDQTIYCQPTWTVKELKHHLAQVYPNKPHPDGQKLIYSGCLLPDQAVISEVLRTYDGQQNNTIHLVYLPSKETLSTKVSVPKCERKEKIRSPTVNISTPPTENNPTVLPSADNGEMRRVPYVMFPNPLPPNTGHDQQQMYQQMMWVQQAYMQYMSQYLQFAYRGTTATPRQRENRREQQEHNVAPINRGVEDDGEDDGHLHRDWLDWVYIVSRVAVLFGVVYFYSSPVRCIMVTTMGLLLYHLGMLRWMPVQNNNNNNNNVNNNRVEGGDDAQDENNEDIPQPQPVPEVQYPNWLMVAWTFLSSFFLSLIPEQREV